MKGLPENRKTALFCMGLAVACVLLFTVSCATPSNPFSDESPYLEGIGDSGYYVFTTSDGGTAGSFFDISALGFTRLSGSYNPLTGAVYGAVEGRFSRSTANTALKLSGQFDKVKGSSITYWRHRESGLEVYVPANDILLFSLDGNQVSSGNAEIAAGGRIEAVYLGTYQEREKKVAPEISTRLLASDIGVYIPKPAVMPDLGLDLSAAAVERFDYVITTVKNGRYDAEFALTTQEFADSFFKLIKAAYVTGLKQRGEKVSVAELKLIITEEGQSVFLREQEYTESMLKDMLLNAL